MIAALPASWLRRWLPPQARGLRYAASLVLLLTLIIRLVPLSPRMPAGGLDPSWNLGMNQATAQGLVIGRDVIFTFGPYASIYGTMYHPRTDALMVWGSLYLALSFAGALAYLFSAAAWWWMLALGVVLLSPQLSPDALLLAYPLLAALVSQRLRQAGAAPAQHSALRPIAVTLLFAPLGLLVLVKGSFLLLCLAITALCCAFFLAAGCGWLALLCVLSPTLSLLFFWALAAQPLAALPGYFSAILAISEGYAGAMSLPGKVGEIAYFLVAAAAALLSILWPKDRARVSRPLVFIACLAYLFLAFKTSFVRHDMHAVAAGSGVMLASLLLVAACRSRLTPLVIVLALVAFFCIAADYPEIDLSPGGIARSIGTRCLGAWRGLYSRLTDAKLLPVRYQQALQALRTQPPLPHMQGTTDIYSYNQALLIASDNTWSPRPVLQSYSAYTPRLAELDREHLLGPTAPDNVLFRVEPIDGRIPSLEDGPSWPVLLHQYRPVGMDPNFVYLRKTPQAAGGPAALPPAHSTHRLGENVLVPAGGGIVFAQITVRPTLFGRLVSFLYKPTSLSVTFQLDGGTATYRLIPGMSAAGFIVSPLVDSNMAYMLLYGNGAFSAARAVRSFAVTTADPGSRTWSPTYEVTFQQLAPPAPELDVVRSLALQSAVNDPVGGNLPLAAACEGFVDTVDGHPPRPAFPASGMLAVSGWMAASVTDGTLPSAVYIVLTDDQGKRVFFPTTPRRRPDVAQHFGRPELEASGFALLANVLPLKGNYSMGIALRRGATTELCPQFHFRASIEDAAAAPPPQ